MTRIQLNQTNTWRQQYNPLRGLTIQKAVSLLEAGQLGQYADLQWTYKFIEETDADLFALIERRASTLCEMDWNIKTMDEDSVGFDKALADAQANELQTAYDRIENLAEAWEHLELAAFRGFSIIQPRYDGFNDVQPAPNDPNAKIVSLTCLDQWNFVRDGLYGRYAWNPSGNAILFRSANPEDIIDPQQFIIRQVPRCINRIGLVKFVRANMSEKDWDAYIEIYGIPGVFVIMPQNIPAGKEKEYEDAAERAAEGAGGALPFGSEVVTSAEARGSQPFDLRLKTLSEKLILAGTGGKLTMLTDSGSGTLAGGAHSESFKSIARSEAAKISQILQRSIDKRIINAKFPGKPVMAYFEIASKEEQKVGDVVAQIAELAQAGFQVDPDQASERTGYKLTLKPASMGVPQYAQSMNRSTVAQGIASNVDIRLQEAATAALAQATADDLKPLRDRIEQALNKDNDAAMLESLKAIPAELPGILKTICRNPAAAKVIEESITAALFNGIAEGVADRKGGK